jgi:hypothetical protein
MAAKQLADIVLPKAGSQQRSRQLGQLSIAVASGGPDQAHRVRPKTDMAYAHHGRHARDPAR